MQVDSGIAAETPTVRQVTRPETPRSNSFYFTQYSSVIIGRCYKYYYDLGLRPYITRNERASTETEKEKMKVTNENSGREKRFYQLKGNYCAEARVCNCRGFKVSPLMVDGS